MLQDTLGHLMTRPRYDVAARLKAEWSQPLTFARDVAAKQGLREEWFTPDEVYYAMATALAESENVDSIRFVDRNSEWHTMSVADLGRRLTRPLPGDDDTCPLSEFLWSTACESQVSRRLERIEFDKRAGWCFEALRARFERNTRRFCGHLTWTTSLDAEEVTNDAWSRAYEAYWSSCSKVRFIGQSRTSTLIYRIAYNIVFAATRAESEFDTEASEVHENGRHHAKLDEHDEHADTETTAAYTEYMLFLTPLQRIVFHARFVEGRRPTDIAHDLGMTKQSVSNHISRGKDRIRRRLEERQRFPHTGSAGET